jgi:hypothetical protein
VRHAAVARATGRDADAAELAELSIEQLAWLGKVLDETEMRLRQNAPQRVLMDLATVRMTRMASLPALASVVEALGRGGAAGAGGGPGGASGGASRPAPPSAPQPPAGPPHRPARAHAAPAVRETPAAPAIRETPAADAEPAPPAADDPSPLAAPAAGLLAPLGEALAAISPALANYLGALGDARLDARGTLVLELRAEKRIWKDRFAQPAAREAVLEAARRVLGQAPAGVEVVVAGNGAAGAGHAGKPAAGATRSTRAQALDAARRDPVVKELFERFGAVLLDGQPLDDGGGSQA